MCMHLVLYFLTVLLEWSLRLKWKFITVKSIYSAIFHDNIILKYTSVRKLQLSDYLESVSQLNVYVFFYNLRIILVIHGCS